MKISNDRLQFTLTKSAWDSRHIYSRCNKMQKLLAYLHAGCSFSMCHNATEEPILDIRNVRIIHFQRKCRQCDYRACIAPLCILKQDQHYELQSRLLYLSGKKPNEIHYSGFLMLHITARCYVEYTFGYMNCWDDLTLQICSIASLKEMGKGAVHSFSLYPKCA